MVWRSQCSRRLLCLSMRFWHERPVARLMGSAAGRGGIMATLSLPTFAMVVWVRVLISAPLELGGAQPSAA